MDEKTFKTRVVHSSRDVLGFFDEYAVSWDERFGLKRSSSAFHRIRLESFLKIANLKKTDRVVELGVGTGPYLDVISRLVQEVICIDGSEQMLHVLRAKHGSISNLKLLQMDLDQHQEEAAFQADLVYFFGVIEHIIDVDTFIANCKSMLKPGGRVVVVASNGSSPWYGAMRRLWRAGRHCSTDKWYTSQQLDNVMVTHGFSLEAISYWGWFPAGTGDVLYHALNLIGNLIERTWLRRCAGGLTASYVFEAKP